ncbi:hypothetical protein NRE35_004331 [Salmonella enterica]|nr:hypothetical protein [Salmonella enterica subsp. enterica serovar Oslo]EEX4841225.1 hypothetical protein [Escherichia coli]EJO2543965.1 hypothetical protein [Salmonella enterica]ELF5187186.1 hypothetical protein [Salmonella enterica]
MDADYWKYSVKDEPKFNEDVCAGFVTKQLEDVVSWIDKFIRSTSNSFPPTFRYVGISVPGPFEQYRRNVLEKDAKREFNIAESDMFLCDLEFEFDDKGDRLKIFHELWLPFGRQGNQIKIKGSMATLHPVQADRFVSVTQTGLFFIIQRAKFNLDKLDVTVSKDGSVYTGVVLKAFLHNESKVKKDSEKWASPTTGHYLFCKYGVTEVFRRYYNSEVYICREDDLDDRYDPDQHYVITSKAVHGRIKAQRQSGENGYTDIRTPYAMIVDRELFDTSKGFVNLVLSFFYVTDRHNDSFNFEDIDRPEDWLKTLAYASFRVYTDLPVNLNKIESHMASLEDYIDEMTKEIIIEEGLESIDTIYDLFVYANDNVIDLMQNTDIGSMWGKYLMVKRYVLSSITFQIINLCWELSKNRDKLTYKSIKWWIGVRLPKTCFLGITKGHGEKTNVQYPGDNMLFKHTLISVRQIDAVITANGKAKINVDDPSYHLHPSIFDSGSIVNFPKPNPDGRNKLNPFITTDEDGKILPNPDTYDLLMSVRDEIGFDH